MTVVNKNKKENACHVSLIAPQIHDKRQLHKWIRKESTDSFLMAAILKENDELKATIIPKRVIEEISNTSQYLGNALEKKILEDARKYLDEVDLDYFDQAISEMYEMAQLSETMFYQTLLPNDDALCMLYEFKEATNFVFSTYDYMFEEEMIQKYHALIHNIDQLEI